MRENKLNDLDNKTWMKFQKSWFIHDPPPRKKNVLTHPAKFPETLVQEFIEFFTKSGQTVLDPMMGTGSTLVAAIRCERNSVGIELSPKYHSIAEEIVNDELNQHALFELPETMLFNNDARNIGQLELPEIDYCITSPPYWNMLRKKSGIKQDARNADDLDRYYSDDENDLGNIEDYEKFLDELTEIYRGVAGVLKDNSYMTVIAQNINRGSQMYPFAWDIGKKVGEFLTLKGERLWCQDNKKLLPYGLGSSFVSNVAHHYCLNFQKKIVD